MSKLDDILKECSMGNVNSQADRIAIAKQQLKDLMVDLVGDVEFRETEDMTLGSWTPDDYKEFGRNELKIALHQKIEKL